MDSVLQVRAGPDSDSVQFESKVYYVNEYEGAATITVTLDFTPTADVTVDYATRNGTAVDCNDYDATSDTLTFSAGETRKTFTVTIHNDDVSEGDESVILTLSNPSGATLGSPDEATLIILDDDAPPTVQFGAYGFVVGESSGEALILVALSRPLTHTVSVDYATSDGTASAGDHYEATSGTLTFAPGQTSASFSVVIKDGASLEGSKTVQLDLSSPNPSGVFLGAPNSIFLTIYEKSASPGGLPLIFFNSSHYVVDEPAQTATIVAALTLPSSETITVDYETANASALAGDDYVATSGTLTFAPGQITTTFTVPIINDALYEGSEHLRLVLSNPTNADLAESHKDIALTIVDNEIRLAVQLDTAIYAVHEDRGPVVLGATLSADYGQPVTVTYSTADDTAVSPADYAAVTSGEVVFSPCQTHQTFSIPIVDDAFDEPDETFTVTLESVLPSPEVAVGHPDAAVVTIIDDDIPMVQFENSTYTVPEDVGNAVITVTLNPTSTWQTVVVDYHTSDDTARAPDDYLMASGTLTFTPGQANHTFSVPIIDDALDEPDETVGLHLSNVSSDMMNDAIITGTNPATLVILDDDPPPDVQFSAADYTIGEAEGTAVITVTLDAPSGRPVTVTYAAADDTATAGADYTAVNGTLEFAPGQTVMTFTVPILDDTLYEGDETVTLSLESAGRAELGDPNPATLTILDDDPPPTVQFSSSDYSVDEGAGTALITVTLNTASGLPATVAYTTEDGTATAPDDYEAVSGTLTFDPGETSQTFEIPIIDDDISELDETVNLTLSQPGDASLGAPHTATLTILDNDVPLITFAQPSYSVLESTQYLTITVELSIAYIQPIQVDYATSDGSAMEGGDYIPASGTLTFESGETAQSFRIMILDDDLDEGDETFFVTLSNPERATIGAPNPITVTIVDDDVTQAAFASDTYRVGEADGPARVRVNLAARSWQTVTVDYATADGTATASDDYEAVSGTLTFPPGETSQTFEVPIIDDDVYEGDETVLLTLSNPDNASLGAPHTATLIIEDDETPPTIQFSAATYTVMEDAGQATITVTLSAPSVAMAAVAYRASDETAELLVDYEPVSGTLTFAPGETQQTFAVDIIDNDFAEPDKTLRLLLDDPVNATLGTPYSATLTIVDDDTPRVKFERADYRYDEAAGTVEIGVILHPASELSVTVDYTTGDGTAIAGDDYEPVSGTLTFAPGEIRQAFSVTIIDDDLYEPDETVVLTLSNPSSNAVLGDPHVAALTILNDDLAYVFLPLILKNHPLPHVQFAASEVRAPEDIGTVVISVTLDRPFPQPVSVDYAAEGGTATAGQDYIVDDGTLTFPPGQTVMTFTVAIIDDALDEHDETVIFQLRNPVRAELGDPNPMTLTIVDNDDPPNVQFSASDYTVGEGEGTAVITMRLDRVSGKQIAVNYATEDGTGAAGQDYVTSSGAATFNPGQIQQTFTVPIIDNDLTGPDKTVILKLSNAVNARLGSPDRATLTILDNDTPSARFSASAYEVNEGAGQATIAVTLDIPPWQTFTVNYATRNGTAVAGRDYSAASGVLTFNPGETRKTFNVTILDDALHEAPETILLRLSDPVNGQLGAPSEATLTIVDNDPPPTVQFSAGGYAVDETVNLATITVTLSAVSGRAASVHYAASDGTATGGEDYEPISGTLTFAPGQTQQTFDIVIIDDLIEEGNETVNLTLSNPVHATLGAPHQATLTIIDDDPIPDLVGSFNLEPDKMTFTEGEPVTITVVITNQGSGLANPFWADFYINPSVPPDAANAIWSDYCTLEPCFGISWYIPVYLGPGESIQLTSTYGSYANGHTVWPGYFIAGTTDLYLYVDSWNPGVPAGAVAESYEDNNRSELLGLEVTAANVAHHLLPQHLTSPRPLRLDE